MVFMPALQSSDAETVELSAPTSSAAARAAPAPAIAARAARTGAALVAAVAARSLRAFRARMPRTPLLLPGYGAQGAGARDVVDAFLPHSSSGARRPWGALVNSSRAISFAYRDPAWAGRSWKDAASAALDRMIAELRAALRAGS